MARIESSRRTAPLASAAGPEKRNGIGVDTGLLRSMIGYQIRMAMNFVTSDLKFALEPFSLRPSLFAILAVVRDNPAISQTALGNALGIHTANLVPLINELAGRRLIERRLESSNRRTVALHLTGEGRGLFEDALRQMREHEEQVFGRLDASDRKGLARILAKLVD